MDRCALSDFNRILIKSSSCEPNQRQTHPRIDYCCLKQTNEKDSIYYRLFCIESFWALFYN